MQRFAIKIDKSVKARLKNLCRLCGIENPNQIEILNAAEWIDLTIEGEVTLSRKIADCVGIQVTKNDRMPQRICALCVDKINDFYEFREMCQATNIQTRKLLNIPEPKAPKKVTIKNEDDDVESIFGIVGANVKQKSEPTVKPVKKSKKAPASSTVTTANDTRFRGMTKREIEITLELERIKKEEEEEKQLADTRTKNGKKRKTPTVKPPTDGMLLAPKEPNQRERKREIQQKRIESKRKSEVKIKLPVKKKVKKEAGLCCKICDERFEKVSLRTAHSIIHHRPNISEYGCSSCLEPITSKTENESHYKWHSMFNIPFKCVICDATFEKLVTFQRHISVCTHPSILALAPFTDSIYCKRCKKEYETQNLYAWHSCFMADNSPCPSCDRVFIKKSLLMKHFFKCTGPISTVEATKKSSGRAKKTNPSSFGENQSVREPQNSFKLEPETIIEPVDEAYDPMDDNYMDTHFGDSDNEFEPNDSSNMTTIEPIAQPTNTPSYGTIAVEKSTPTTSSISMAKKSTTCISSKQTIRTNLGQPLLECHVKLEPLDMSSLTTSTGSINVAQIENQTLTVPPLVISRPTVPPLTIRIKKELVQPGYGDEFDANVAQNIKLERIDETWELASTSKSSGRTPSTHKKSKHRSKEKKLYKKPALLAIKIKQERMEREENDSEYYPDYSVPSNDYANENLMNQTFDNNPLPIITQIHSVLQPSPIIPINPMAVEQSLTAMNSIPFFPIRIKSEFQEPLSPPPVDQVEPKSLINKFAEITSSSEHVTVNSVENQIDIRTLPQYESVECSTKLTPNENCDLNLQLLSSMDHSSDNIESENLNKPIEDSSGNSDDAKLNPDTVVCPINSAAEDRVAETIYERDSEPYQENEIVSCPSEIVTEQQMPPKEEEQHHHQFDDKTNRIENDIHVDEHSNVKVSIESDIYADPSIQHSTKQMDSIEDIENKQSSSDDQFQSPNDENVQNAIKSTYNDVLDAIANENMSPIEFHDQNPNDNSLNFIDQLVHDVADTMVSQIEAVEADENIANILDMEFNNTTFNIDSNVVCLDRQLENVVDSGSDAVTDEIAKNAVNDDLLVLSDIPEIDYSDLLPTLNPIDSTEHKSKSNGNEAGVCLPNEIKLDEDRNGDNQIEKLMDGNPTSDEIQPNIPLN